MGANKQNVTHHAPCMICGKPDWCFRMDFGADGILHYCARIRQDSVLSGGTQFIFKRETKEHFFVYEDKDQYDYNHMVYIEEQQRLHPERFYRKYSGKTPAVPSVSAPIEYKELEREPMVEPLPPEKLDAIYRSFLSMLILEDKHKAVLAEEWDKEPGLMQKILTLYPIVSIPPEDRIRFFGKEKLKNPSRKQICARLVSQFGSLQGVPGFYQRKTGEWTFTELSGIVFPVFDTRGNLIRIRLKDDYPAVKGAVNGHSGTFSHYENQWYFTDDETKQRKVIREELELLVPTKHGIPCGKVSGKYKNFSSYKEDKRNNRICNRYLNGCQSGSYCSLYSRDGDDWSTVLFTEGEKKAIVANMLTGNPVVSIPGVNCYSKLFEPEDGLTTSIISYLISKGMKVAVIAYDADKAVNEIVLRAETGATMEMINNGIKVAIGEWNANWGKGLDDILIQGIMPQLQYVT